MRLRLDHKKQFNDRPMLQDFALGLYLRLPISTNIPETPLHLHTKGIIHLNLLPYASESMCISRSLVYTVCGHQFGWVEHCAMAKDKEPCADLPDPDILTPKECCCDDECLNVALIHIKERDASGEQIRSMYCHPVPRPQSMARNRLLHYYKRRKEAACQQVTPIMDVHTYCQAKRAR